jgi:hypothetical protein
MGSCLKIIFKKRILKPRITIVEMKISLMGFHRRVEGRRSNEQTWRWGC